MFIFNISTLLKHNYLKRVIIIIHLDSLLNVIFFIVEFNQMEYKMLCVRYQVNTVMFKRKYAPCHNPIHDL